jgi:type II secretory pathway pseudopilin PulG
MNRPPAVVAAFSLIELVVALGIVAFALLTMVALLPIGMKVNQVSVEETRAANLLTALEADLRNTHPSLNGGKSKLFGLPLPYTTSSGTVVLNSALTDNATTLPSTDTTGVNEDESLAAISANPRPRYQVSVIYIKTSGDLPVGSLAPYEARLIVNWPSVNTTSVSNLTSNTNVSGFVEAYVSFPAP